MAGASIMQMAEIIYYTFFILCDPFQGKIAIPQVGASTFSILYLFY